MSGVEDSRAEDSRLKGYNGKVLHPSLPLERTYCLRCSRPWGWVSQDSSNLVAPSNIQVICDPCFEAMTLDAGNAPPSLEVPRSALEMYGLIDENDPRVRQLKESTRLQQGLERRYAAEHGLACPACGQRDYHFEDNPDNPEGPQVVICHPCSASGSRTGWLLRERLNFVIA